MPMKRRPSCITATPVVPLPMNGSNTVVPGVATRQTCPRYCTLLYAAAGMLSPAAEVWYGEEAVLRLGSASLRLWPDLAARLGVELRRRGTLLVGYDAADLQEVDRQVELLTRHGHDAQQLDRIGVRDLPPLLFAGTLASGCVQPQRGPVQVAAQRERHLRRSLAELGRMAEHMVDVENPPHALAPRGRPA